MNWQSFVNRLVMQVLGSISGNLLKGLNELEIKFREDARATANPWDDVLADLICSILNVDNSEEEE